jgi:branched-chain amino acid transport system ATP-binding protein
VSDLLKVEGLSTGYGDVQAIWDVSLAVRSGEVTVLLGPNGAGKTTVLSAIMGLLPAWHGHITLADADVTGTSAHYRARHGIALVQEGKRVFRRRTIEENLLLGGYPTTHNRKRLREAVDEQFERFPILRTRRRRAAATLSGGEQQMLALAQALMSRPRALILDEPSAGLAPVILNELFGTFAALKREGLAILLVEQLVHRALAIADDVIVLAAGHVAHRAHASEITDASLIGEVYFRAAPAPVPSATVPPETEGEATP